MPKQYTVYIDYEGTRQMGVEADSPEEAIRIAKERDETEYMNVEMYIANISAHDNEGNMESEELV